MGCRVAYKSILLQYYTAREAQQTPRCAQNVARPSTRGLDRKALSDCRLLGHKNRMLALAGSQVPGLHPFVGSVEEFGVVVVDVFITEEGAQQFFGLQRVTHRIKDVVGIAAEIRL